MVDVDGPLAEQPLSRVVLVLLEAVLPVEAAEGEDVVVNLRVRPELLELRHLVGRAQHAVVVDAQPPEPGVRHAGLGRAEVQALSAGVVDVVVVHGDVVHVRRESAVGVAAVRREEADAREGGAGDLDELDLVGARRLVHEQAHVRLRHGEAGELVVAEEPIVPSRARVLAATVALKALVAGLGVRIVATREDPVGPAAQAPQVAEHRRGRGADADLTTLVGDDQRVIRRPLRQIANVDEAILPRLQVQPVELRPVHIGELGLDVRQVEATIAVAVRLRQGERHRGRGEVAKSIARAGGAGVIRNRSGAAAGVTGAAGAADADAGGRSRFSAMPRGGPRRGGLLRAATSPGPSEQGYHYKTCSFHYHGAYVLSRGEWKEITARPLELLCSLRFFNPHSIFACHLLSVAVGRVFPLARRSNRGCRTSRPRHSGSGARRAVKRGWRPSSRGAGSTRRRVGAGAPWSGARGGAALSRPASAAACPPRARRPRSTRPGRRGQRSSRASSRPL